MLCCHTAPNAISISSQRPRKTDEAISMRITWENESLIVVSLTLRFLMKEFYFTYSCCIWKKKKSLNNFITMVNSKGRFHNVRKRKGILMGRTNPLLSGLLGQKKKSRKENNRNLQKKVWSSREEEMRLREFKLFCQNHSANDERTKL